MIAISSGGPVLYVRCREWRPGLSPHYSFHEEKKKFVIFSLRLLVYFLLPCICFNCFLGSTFLCESRVFNVSCVSRVLLIHAYGCQPHTPFHCMRSETPSCKRKKKVSSHSLSPYCFSSDVRAVVSCELSKALMVIRCLHRREPPGRWK